MTFGEFVRNRRKELNMTQDELSKKTGISRGSISNIEKDVHSVIAAKIDILAAALEVDPTELMSLKLGKTNNIDDSTQKIIDYACQLAPEDKEKVIFFLESLLKK